MNFYVFNNCVLKIFFIILSSSNQISCSLTTIHATEVWQIFLSSFISNLFPNSKLFFIYGDFFASNTHSLSAIWLDKMEGILTQNHIISNSGGITNLKLPDNYSDFRIISRTPKTSSEILQVVILFLPLGIPSTEQETLLFRRLNEPLLDPSTVRNADKYFIITEKQYLSSVQKCGVIKSLKYKLFMTPNLNEARNGLSLIQYCLHCPIQEKIINFPVPLKKASKHLHEDLSQLSEYFPDFQRNYFGYVLRVSSTDKMEGDLEFAVDSNGKTYAKRGVFAAAMYHLAEGLNFTAELFQASAGGSTGHVQNNTWVGSVGDVYSGDASFCMLCGMSYNRHFIVEICSPVTYEKIRFAIGPSTKLYTWQSILWPFDAYLWMALSISTLMTMFCSHLFLKYQDNESGWNISIVSQYFARICIEQSQNLPYGLPESIKVIMGFWLLFSMIATCLYRAKMVTFMTFPVFEHSPDTYDELIQTPYQIEFHYFPNIAYNSFKTSTNPVIMEVFQKMIKQPDPIKCLQHTLEVKSVCIMFTSVHEDLLGRNMSDNFGLSPIRSSTQYAFMFTPGISSQKRADFSPNFRRILQTFLQMGLNDWWKRSDAMFLLRQKNAWIKSLPPGENRAGVFQYDSGDSDDVLHLKHLKGAFSVVFGGLLIALLVFVLELLGKVWEKITVKKEKAKKKWKAQANLILFLNYVNNDNLRNTDISTGFYLTKRLKTNLHQTILKEI